MYVRITFWIRHRALWAPVECSSAVQVCQSSHSGSLLREQQGCYLRGLRDFFQTFFETRFLHVFWTTFFCILVPKGCQKGTHWRQFPAILGVQVEM